jgi:hypothetical protein
MFDQIVNSNASNQDEPCQDYRSKCVTNFICAEALNKKEDNQNGY